MVDPRTLGQHPLPQAQALVRVLREAEDIARATSSRLTTAHVLLALFTVKNHAERLLRDRGIDEDRILELMPSSMKEPKHVLEEVLARAAQVAAGCGALQVDTLHLLVAITRERDAMASGLLEATGDKLGHLRTRALTIATGAVPRWLEGRSSRVPEPAEVPVPPPADQPSTPPVRTARSERAERIERLERSEHPDRARSERAERAEHQDRVRRSEVSRRASREDRHDRRAALDWSPPILTSQPKGRRHELPSELKRVPTATPASELSTRGQDGVRRSRHDAAPSRHDPALGPGRGSAHGRTQDRGPHERTSADRATQDRAAHDRATQGRAAADHAAAERSALPARSTTPAPAPSMIAPAESLLPAKGRVQSLLVQELGISQLEVAEPVERVERLERGRPAKKARSEVQDPAEPWLLEPGEYPWLTSLGRNLSAEAARGELDSLVGREKEVEELIDILGKRRANNPCLIGEPGVGKTAVVEGLALRLVRQKNNEALRRKIIVGLDVGALLVGTHLRGSFSEKLQGLKEEVKQSGGRVIAFFDELHTLVGAGSTGDGPQDAANELKTALARGDFPCIGATTRDEWVKHIEPDAALKRRFYPVLVKEPSPPEAIEMLAHIVPAYADHHGVDYDKDAIHAAVTLSSRYITDRHLPDKAIALLDLAGSRANRAGAHLVTKELVAALVSEQTELPVERLLASDRERLLQLEKHLEREVVGHRRQLHRIAEVIRRNAAGFSSRRPQGVFLFIGPTGVGKTETAKAIAKILHGSEDRMLRFDLSEFSEAHAVARLVGAPPGYVGHDAGGQLTEAVRRKPGRVILFDEIEKAHRDVLQLLLQILDEGRLTDGRGQTVSFAETIVILTSNLGSDLARARRPIGFSEGASGERLQLEQLILDRAREGLAPELWGRIEERLVFAPLTKDEVREIARLLAAESSRRLFRERGITYALDDYAIDYLVEQGGYDLSLGARPMRAILSRIVEAPIAARILEGRLHADEHVQVSTRANGGLAFLVGEERTSLSQRPTLRRS